MKALITAIVAAAIATPAISAEPNTAGVIRSGVLCDTKEQLFTILQAYQRSFDEGIEALNMHGRIPSPHGGPACVAFGNARFPVFFSGESVEFVDVNGAQGKRSIYAVPIVYENMRRERVEGWLTLGEPVKERKEGA